ncbi:hypothetical protein ACQJBY_053996 [Aegilops geniculata]
MALRSLIRKMPAVGLRSTPMPPRMGPVHALSTAAGSRIMSHGAPGINGRAKIYSEDEIAERREAIKRLHAEIEKDRAVSERYLAEHRNVMEMLEQQSAAGEAAYNAAMRDISEARVSCMKTLKNVATACDVVAVACPMLIILMMITT